MMSAWTWRTAIKGPTEEASRSRADMVVMLGEAETQMRWPWGRVDLCRCRFLRYVVRGFSKGLACGVMVVCGCGRCGEQKVAPKNK
jgi:hypothetical protein